MRRHPLPAGMTVVGGNRCHRPAANAVAFHGCPVGWRWVRVRRQSPPGRAAATGGAKKTRGLYPSSVIALHRNGPTNFSQERAGDQREYQCCINNAAHICILPRVAEWGHRNLPRHFVLELNLWGSCPAAIIIVIGFDRRALPNYFRLPLSSWPSISTADVRSSRTASR